MANVKKLPRIEMIPNLLQEALQLAKEEYAIKPTNQLSSIMINLELTLIELKKIKDNGLNA